jgi:FecR protein
MTIQSLWQRTGVAGFLCSLLFFGAGTPRSAACEGFPAETEAPIASGVAEGQPQTDEAGAVSALLPNGVAVRHSQQTDLALHDGILWDDLVKTIDNGRMRILLVDNSVLNIGARSSMHIVPHDAASKESKVVLEFGRIRAKVIQKAAPGRTFVVDTPTAVLGVEGTHFYVRSDDNGTTVICFEDTVRVHNIDPKIAGEQVLHDGELTTVLRGQPPTPKRPATPQEIQQAMEETLPAEVAHLQPFRAPAGTDPRVVMTGPALDQLPKVSSEGDWLSIEPGPCATKGYVTARLKLKPDLKPGAYEFTMDTPEGPEMGAFQVEPPSANAPEIGRMLHAPQIPAEALHRARVVTDAGKALAGQRVKIVQNGKESVVETDANGTFEVQAKKPGTIDLFLEGTNRRSRIEVVKPKELALEDAGFGRAGSLESVQGIFPEARIGQQALATTTTVMKNGEGFTSYLLPPDMEEGPAKVTLVDSKGNTREQSTFVFRIIGGRLDDPSLISGQTTQGEFVVCFGNAQSGQQLFANLTAIGFVRFLGEGGGHTIHKAITVEGQGAVHIPFQILATTGAGPGVPFNINLTISGKK